MEQQQSASIEQVFHEMNQERRARGENVLPVCWHAQSQVMRFIPDQNTYEKVSIRSLAVGDEVLVHNPESKTVGREKITRIHDHGKDRHRSN